MGLFLIVVAPLVCEFALALQVGAVLASDAVTECVHSVQHTNPSDVSCKKKVDDPVLALPSGAVGNLSSAFSRGLTLVYIGCWTMTMGGFALLIKHGAGEAAMWFTPMYAPFLFFPMVMSTAVAEVSSSCDDLTNEINRKRIGDLDESPKILALELALNNLNTHQGLGFTIFDSTVLDKKKLRTLYVAVATGFGTIIPLLIAYGAAGADRFIYASFTNTETVYAMSTVKQQYIDNVNFCHQLWMEPVKITSFQQVEALLALIPAGQRLSVGAVRGAEYNPLIKTNCEESYCCPKENDFKKSDMVDLKSFNDDRCTFRWADGTKFGMPKGTPKGLEDFSSWDGNVKNAKLIDDKSRFENWNQVPWDVILSLTRVGTHTYFRADDSPSGHGIICEAPSLVSIRGAIPTVLSLGRLDYVPKPKAPPNADVGSAKKLLNKHLLAQLKDELVHGKVTYANITLGQLLGS